MLFIFIIMLLNLTDDGGREFRAVPLKVVGAVLVCVVSAGVFSAIGSPVVDEFSRDHRGVPAALNRWVTRCSASTCFRSSCRGCCCWSPSWARSCSRGDRFRGGHGTRFARARAFGGSLLHRAHGPRHPSESHHHDDERRADAERGSTSRSSPSRAFTGGVEGQVIAFLVIVLAAAEAALGLAILVALRRDADNVNVDEFTTLRG